MKLKEDLSFSVVKPHADTQGIFTYLVYSGLHSPINSTCSFIGLETFKGERSFISFKHHWVRYILNSKIVLEYILVFSCSSSCILQYFSFLLIELILNQGNKAAYFPNFTCMCIYDFSSNVYYSVEAAAVLGE